MFQLANRKKFEKMLDVKVSFMCKTLGLKELEWDKDEMLFAAIKKHPQFKRIHSTCSEYDALMDSAKMMNVNIESHYSWFYQLNKKKEIK